MDSPNLLIYLNHQQQLLQQQQQILQQQQLQYQQQQQQQQQQHQNRLKQMDQQNDVLDQKNKQDIAQILRMVETDQQNKLKQSKFHHHPNCLYHLQHQQPNNSNISISSVNNAGHSVKPNLTNMFAFKENTLNQAEETQQQSASNANNSQTNTALLPTSSNICCHCNQSMASEAFSFNQTKLANVASFKQAPLINQV